MMDEGAEEWAEIQDQNAQGEWEASNNAQAQAEAEEFASQLDQSDKEFINKQNLGGRMEPTYNKVQYSEFTPDRVGQWVLRGDTIEEVLEMKKTLFGLAKPLTPAETPAKPVVPVTTSGQAYTATPPVDDGLLVPCKECKGPTTYRTGFSKKDGKPWKAYFCQDKSKECKPWFIK